MNLTLFFRLICTAIFQKNIVYSTISKIYEEEMNYNNTFFTCPRVYAKDGWNVSLQINNGNYCESENGYRKLGHTFKKVEFGYPSNLDEELLEFAEQPTNNTVGSCPIEVLEKIFEKHGGIDWEKTISTEYFDKKVIK